MPFARSSSSRSVLPETLESYRDCRWRWLCGLFGRNAEIAFASAGTLVILFCLLEFWIHSDPSYPQREIFVALGPVCGPTWAQAEEAGCVYDLIISAWTSPQCHDSQLYNQYLSEVNSTFYLERQQKNVVSWEQVLSGRHPEEGLWTDGGFHHLHCSYAWDRQRSAYARATATGQPVILDTFSRNQTHTSHCIFWNAHPKPEELVAPNITHIYPPREPVRCLAGY
ncbi:hypothetical protein LZ30DRAFT_736931 [Colletotrichum cereale]|nr:hypothetical protein LZ30DRAFT_736931 [Colletotrichum cereale]